MSSPAAATFDAHPSAALALASQQYSVATLSDRVHALIRRCAASKFGAQHSTGALVRGINAAAREAAFDCGVIASQAAKALECAEEEARVCSLQLAACAELLEMGAVGGEENAIVIAVARALSSCPDWDATSFVGFQWASAVLLAVDEAVRVRDGVEPALCTVSGKGILQYQTGAGDNCVSVGVEDGEGDVVESIEAEDVTVILSIEGACVTHVGVREAGVVDMAYRVCEGCVGPISFKLSVSVCGVMLSGSPWSVVCPLGDSAILASVAPERMAAFVQQLAVWLHDRNYTLLYRGSRDGMTPAAFHSLCDDKGPTLVLVRCDQRWVFGGHAGASWDSSGHEVACSDAFLFSVTGPRTTVPVRFPIKPISAPIALYGAAACGPIFNGGLNLIASREYTLTDDFDEKSSSDVGTYYEDTTGWGSCGLTGTEFFAPVELEVYAATRMEN